MTVRQHEIDVLSNENVELRKRVSFLEKQFDKVILREAEHLKLTARLVALMEVSIVPHLVN